MNFDFFGEQLAICDAVVAPQQRQEPLGMLCGRGPAILADDDIALARAGGAQSNADRAFNWPMDGVALFYADLHRSYLRINEIQKMASSGLERAVHRRPGAPRGSHR